MSQLTIGERLKFLLTAFDLKVGPFARMMGVSDTNIRNYLDRGSKPSADFLENLIRNFDTINPGWLLTGEGEPLIDKKGDKVSTTATVTKNSGIVGTHGTQYNFSMPENFDSCKQQLALLTIENEGMKSTIAALEAALGAKEEILTLLRVQHNRPN